MSEIVIEKGVPIPKRSWSQYPFGRMEIGDSFTVPLARRHAAYCAAGAYGRRHGRRFTVRTEGNLVRVWRLE